MGMLGKSGKYFANPAIGRAHERSARDEAAPKGASAEEKEPQEGEESPEGHAGDAHAVHVHHMGGGRFHSVTHGPSGSQMKEHGSLEEAHQHVRDAFAAHEGGGNGEEAGETAAPDLGIGGGEGY